MPFRRQFHAMIGQTRVDGLVEICLGLTVANEIDANRWGGHGAAFLPGQGAADKRKNGNSQSCIKDPYQAGDTPGIPKVGERTGCVASPSLISSSDTRRKSQQSTPTSRLCESPGKLP